jgi:hypothetical protein
MASMIRGQYNVGKSSWIKWVSGVQGFFPYIYGAANFCLYVSFPFLMLVLMIFCRMSLFLKYMESFIWIKSWTMTSGIAYYISLFVAQIQAQASDNVNWFWDYPYFVAVSSVLLIVLPIVSFVGIHQSFQFLTNRS